MRNIRGMILCHLHCHWASKRRTELDCRTVDVGDPFHCTVKSPYLVTIGRWRVKISSAPERFYGRTRC